MDTLFQELLSVLNGINDGLIRLSNLELKKKEIVMSDDLLALNEIINSEQAEALSFRGLEHKRVELLKKLNIPNRSMQATPSIFPQELRGKAEQAVQQIQRNYEQYQITSAAARKLLENGLSDIDHILAAMGEHPAAGPGYGEEEVKIPSNMKTDFRA